LPRKPITGMSFCCARSVGAAVSAPPNTSSSSRRLIWSPRFAPSRSSY